MLITKLTGITIIKSKKLNKKTKINNCRKNINITNNQYKTELYSKDEIKRITISDIKNWIPKSNIDGYKLFTDKKEAQIFGENLYGNWSKDLKNKYNTYLDYALNPYNALKAYAGNIYMELNRYLRAEVGNVFYSTDVIEYFKDIIKNIEVAFSNVPKLDENIIVFRRVCLCQDDNLKNYYYFLKEGDEIKDKGYMSTSLILDKAVKIHGQTIDDSYALLVIKISKGENCIFIDEVDGYMEYEILVNKNKTLKLEKILVKNDKQIVLLCELQK